MKIFITGLAGFLGSNLGIRLANEGHEIYGNDNLIGGYRDNVDKRFKFFESDCCDLEKMANIIPEDTDVAWHTKFRNKSYSFKDLKKKKN